MASISSVVLTNTILTWFNRTNTLIGLANDQLISDVLATLTTTEKTTLVGAINELDSEIGTLSSLDASISDKTNLVAALNEVLADLNTTISSGLAAKADISHTHTFGDITGSGALASLDDVDLTSLVTGILPVANGGTGGSTPTAARSALGIGTAGTYNIGTSGATVPVLNGNNTFSGSFTASHITPTFDTGSTTKSSLGVGSAVVTGEVARINLFGHDSAGNNTNYGAIASSITDNTNGSEDGTIDFYSMTAGTITKQGYYGQGLVWGTPTDGDKGAGTANFESLYINGSAVTAGSSGVTLAYTSSDTAVSTGTELTFSHGIGSAPDHVKIQLVCQTGESGFVAGEIIDIYNGHTNSGAEFNAFASFTSSSIYVRVGNNGFRVFNTSGQLVDLTNGNWKIRVKAYTA